MHKNCRKQSNLLHDDSTKIIPNGTDGHFINNNNNNSFNNYDKRPPIPSASNSANTTPTTRLKLGFRDRHWTEIEKLWRGKAREPPNIESLLKPQASFRSKDRQARARTLPFSSTSTPSPLPTTPITTSTSVSHLGSGYRNASSPVPRWPPPTSPTGRKLVHKTVSASSSRSSSSSSSMSTTASLLAAHSQAVMPAVSMGRLESPLATRKAIDLLAPHVLNAWQNKDYDRTDSVPSSIDTVSMSSNESVEEETDHFVELVKAW